MSRKRIVDYALYNHVESVNVIIKNDITDEVKSERYYIKCLEIRELEDTQGRRFFEIEIHKRVKDAEKEN